MCASSAATLLQNSIRQPPIQNAIPLGPRGILPSSFPTALGAPSTGQNKGHPWIRKPRKDDDKGKVGNDGDREGHEGQQGPQRKSNGKRNGMGRFPFFPLCLDESTRLPSELS